MAVNIDRMHFMLADTADVVGLVTDAQLVASTHLAKHVPQVIPRNRLVCLQVVEQHIAACGEVARVEGVASAEAHATATACAYRQRLSALQINLLGYRG
jgi:hypothetical protein